MRTLLGAMVLAFCLGLSVVRAADVEFECDATLFEQTVAEKPAATELGFRFVTEGGETYVSPLYEGLWPMTLKAFRRGEFRTDDKEVFTFSIASSDEDVSRCLNNFMSPFFPAYDSPVFDGLWRMTRDAFQVLDQEKWNKVPVGMVIAQNR